MGSLRALKRDLLTTASNTKALKVCAQQPRGCARSWTNTLMSEIKGKMASVCIHLRTVVCSMPQDVAIDCKQAPRCDQVVRAMMLMAVGRKDSWSVTQVRSHTATYPVRSTAVAVSQPTAQWKQLADGHQFFFTVSVLVISLFVSSHGLIPSVQPQMLGFLACMIVSASGLMVTFVHLSEEVRVKGLFAEVADKFDHVNRAAVTWNCTADLDLGFNLRSITALAPNFHTDLTSWWVSAVVLLLLALARARFQPTQPDVPSSPPAAEAEPATPPAAEAEPTAPPAAGVEPAPAAEAEPTAPPAAEVAQQRPNQHLLRHQFACWLSTLARAWSPVGRPAVGNLRQPFLGNEMPPAVRVGTAVKTALAEATRAHVGGPTNEGLTQVVAKAQAHVGGPASGA